MWLAVAVGPAPVVVEVEEEEGGEEEEEAAEETPDCSQEEEEGNPEKGQGWSWAATWVLLLRQEGTEGPHLPRGALRAVTPREEGLEGAETGWLSASLPRAPETAGKEAVLHRSSAAWATWVAGLGQEEQGERVGCGKQEKLAAFLLGEPEV